jgi:hypothetical protein
MLRLVRVSCGYAPLPLSVQPSASPTHPQPETPIFRTHSIPHFTFPSTSAAFNVLDNSLNSRIPDLVVHLCSKRTVVSSIPGFQFTSTISRTPSHVHHQHPIHLMSSASFVIRHHGRIIPCSAHLSFESSSISALPSGVYPFLRLHSPSSRT